MFNRLLFPFALALFASTFSTLNAQDKFSDRFTPTANRWSILIYASDSNSRYSESFKNFRRLANSLRSSDASENVVVFSPFESAANRRPTFQTLDALLAWFRENQTRSGKLGLEAARGDREAPLEIRLFVCGQSENNELRLPDSNSTQTIKIDAFRSALREGDRPCERTLLFFNLASETRTRGSSAVLAPLVDEAPTFNDESNNAWGAAPRQFQETYFRTLFFNQSDAQFFAVLADAFEGDADVLNADKIVTAFEIRDYLRNVSSVAPGIELAGQDFPIAQSRKTPPAPPSDLFLKAAGSLSGAGQGLLAQEATRRVFAKFRQSDYERLRFSQNRRPTFEQIRDGDYILSPRDDSWLILRLNSSSNNIYYLEAASFAEVAQAVGERSAR